MPFPLSIQRCARLRCTIQALVSVPNARLHRAFCMVVAAAVCWSAPSRAQRDPVVDTDLLGLASASPGVALPTGWQTRAVRGQRLPMSRIIDSSGIRFMRLSSAGHAGWFVRELPAPLVASAGQLQWTWRATLAPVGADVGTTETDDATLRVFVVFGRHGRFAWKPRVLFYTLADGLAMPDRTDSPFAGRIAGRPARARDWVPASADPFDDYQRIWRTAPPPIVAVGVMQDTDQTRSPAIGDLLTLYWRGGNAARP